MLEDSELTSKAAVSDGPKFSGEFVCKEPSLPEVVALLIDTEGYGVRLEVFSR